MSVWLIIAVLSVAATAGLAWPLLGKRKPEAGEDPAHAVFRHQLDEVDGEVERGLMSAEEARVLRAEIARRMLQTDRAETGAAGQAVGPGPPLRLTGLVILVCLAGAAVGVYAFLGTPGLPDQPLASRSLEGEKAASRKAEISAMAARLAERLVAEPKNLDAWLLLARTHRATENHAAAAAAFARAHALADGDAGIAAAYGEAQVMADGGAFSAVARAAFAKARVWDPLEPKSLFYMGLDWAQRGAHAKALGAWINLVNISPPDAPWLAMIRQRIAQVAKAGGIDPASIKPTLSAPTRKTAP